MRRSGWIWAGRMAAVLLLAGLGAYLFSMGLDKASMLAGVLGLLVAVGALIAPYLLPLPDHDHGGQYITDTVAGGNLTQIRDARGVHVLGPVITGPLPDQSPRSDRAPDGQGSQHVNGVWVGGNLTQVDGTDGDVTIG
jgi:hypothetical protein